jgi:hypothetical protein
MVNLSSRAAEVLSQVIAWLASGDFRSVEARSRGVRLSADSIRQAVMDYGKTLVMPPDSAFSDVDSIRVLGADRPTWSVRFDLWTQEEGRSDLSLECTIIESHDGSVDIEIDNIHVL